MTQRNSSVNVSCPDVCNPVSHRHGYCLISPITDMCSVKNQRAPHPHVNLYHLHPFLSFKLAGIVGAVWQTLLIAFFEELTHNDCDVRGLLSATYKSHRWQGNVIVWNKVLEKIHDQSVYNYTHSKYPMTLCALLFIILVMQINVLILHYNLTSTCFIELQSTPGVTRLHEVTVVVGSNLP